MNRNRVILHVDDDPSILRVIDHQLGKKGYEVKSHSDPNTALQVLRDTNSRLVILDIDMPGVDGLTLLKEMKRHDGGVQVIMLTGLVSLSTVLRSMRLGAEACLFKPVTDTEPLFSVVEAAFTKIDRWWYSLHDLSQMKSRERQAATTEAE